MTLPRIALLTASVLLPSCTQFKGEPPSPLGTPQPEKVQGIDVPDSPPLRDDFTSYLKVAKDGVTIGYAVRYDALPDHVTEDPAGRPFPEGTILIEDNEFERIGFVTSLGQGYRYYGRDAEEVGQGTLEELLPGFFGQGSYSVVKITQ